MRERARDMKRKRPAERGRSNFIGRFKLFLALGAGLDFLSPIAQAQEFPDLSAFVSIFLGFGRPIINLTERMFCISDSFLNQVKRFGHTQFLYTQQDELP